MRAVPAPCWRGANLPAAFQLSGAAFFDMMLRATIIVTGALLLACCGQKDNDPGPGGVTIGEARALDEAAEMIERGRPAPDLLDTTPSPTASTAPAAR
jgi:hypothetical protein